MTGRIWESFLHSWDKDLQKKNRRILLLADNCSAHMQVTGTGLLNIKVEFLPPNTTSVLQPCDVGNHSLCQGNLSPCQQVLQQMDESTTVTACELAKKITLLDVILVMKAAWEEIDVDTIRNCWVKAGLKVSPHERPAHTSQMTVPSELPMNKNNGKILSKVTMTWKLCMLSKRMTSWKWC